ncbi:hypothetical protein [Quatrionicoccus australiensis]|nr:hypothetical protein [Quatrionicoccus australiensis]
MGPDSNNAASGNSPNERTNNAIEPRQQRDGSPIAASLPEAKTA